MLLIIAAIENLSEKSYDRFSEMKIRKHIPQHN